MKAILVFALFVAIAAAGKKSSNVYKLYNVVPKNEMEIYILMYLYFDDICEFSLDSVDIGTSVHIMVASNFQTLFEDTLNANGIKFIILSENVGSTINEGFTRQKFTLKSDEGTSSYNPDHYYRYDEIQNYLEVLAHNYADIVALETIATTYDERNITMIKIGKGGRNNPIIFIDGGIHAREWIAPAQVLYIVKQLVENEDNRALIENISWYIVPLLNPDGYEYSHTNDRGWRKNRSPGTKCYGVDLNRNFGFHWMEVGADLDDCSIVYAGKHEFSEPETIGLRNIIKKYSDKIKLYLTFHSAGSYILYPWGYTTTYPDDVSELNNLAYDVAAAISSAGGTRYTIGSSSNVLYPAAGGSDDWVKGIAGVDLAYTIELPPGGTWGYDLPVSEISRVVQETWEGVLVYYNYISYKYTS